MANIISPFWHPVLAQGFILDWDGVIADTDLDFSGIRNKYFGGKRVPLIEAGKWLSEARQVELWQDICVLEMEGAENAVPVNGAFELIEWFGKTLYPLVCCFPEFHGIDQTCCFENRVSPSRGYS